MYSRHFQQSKDQPRYGCPPYPFSPCPHSRQRILRPRESGSPVPFRDSPLFSPHTGIRFSFLSSEGIYVDYTASLHHVRAEFFTSPKYRWHSPPRVTDEGPLVLQVVRVTNASYSGRTPRTKKIYASRFPYPFLVHYVHMYVCMVTHIGRIWINRVRLPILLVFSLTGKLDIYRSAFVPENLVSRDGFGSPVPHQPAHLHTQDESSAYLLGSSRVSRRRPFIYIKPPYAIGSVPSFLGHANAYR